MLRTAAAVLLGATLTLGPAAPGPAITVASRSVTLASGASTDVVLPVDLGPVPRRVDVMVVIDISGSMARQLPALRREVAQSVRGLVSDGMDVRAGLAVAGTTPAKTRSNVGKPPSNNPDPLRDPADTAYRPPVAFRRVLPVGPVVTFLAALAQVATERYPSGSDFPYFDRQQGQLLALHQLMTGAGFAGSVNDDLQDSIPPGQTAGWREDTTRVLLNATDETFANPEGTPRTAAGLPDVGLVRRELAAAHVRVASVVPFGYAAAVEQLGTLSAEVPPGGVRCGGLRGADLVPAGAPLVCSTGAPLLPALAGTRPGALLRVVDPTDPVVSGAAPLDPRPFDTASTHHTGVRLTASCPTASTGSVRDVPVTVAYAGSTAVGRLQVVCAAAAVGPAPVAPGQPPPAPVAPQPPVAPAAGAPVPGGPAPAPALGVQPGTVTQPATAAARQQERAALSLLVIAMTFAALSALAWRRREQPEPEATRSA